MIVPSPAFVRSYNVLCDVPWGLLWRYRLYSTLQLLGVTWEGKWGGTIVVSGEADTGEDHQKKNLCIYKTPFDQNQFQIFKLEYANVLTINLSSSALQSSDRFSCCVTFSDMWETSVDTSSLREAKDADTIDARISAVEELVHRRSPTKEIKSYKFFQVSL